MAQEVTIGKISEVRGVTGAGQVETLIDVEYTVGEEGPFHLQLRPAEFTQQKIEEETQKIASTINAVKP